MDTRQPSDLDEAVAAIHGQGIATPETALVLGSGLGSLAEAVEDAVVVSTGDIRDYPRSTAPGHQGRLVFGKLEGSNVAIIQGRAHVYEGYSARRAVFPIRLVHALGARRLIVTNAAGGIRPSFSPGTLMFITDHINFAFENPLIGPNEGDGPRFADLSDAYDANWLEQAEREALQAGIATRRGVYLWTKGPSYESKAEINLYRTLGAEAVGMSTVPEVLQANYLGMKVLGISTITNPAAGLSPIPLKHEDVLEAGRTIRVRLEALVRCILQNT